MILYKNYLIKNIIRFEYLFQKFLNKNINNVTRIRKSFIEKSRHWLEIQSRRNFSNIIENYWPNKKNEEEYKN